MRCGGKRLAVLIGVASWALAGLAASAVANPQAVRFGTDWKAEAEHGGYYEAIATGIYRRYGLDVQLRQGGPQVDHARLLAAGRLDFNIVDSGDAKKDGIGAMTAARWRDFFNTMASAGVYPKDMDYKKAYTLQFIDKKVGMKS
jgi:hypothetical protein